MTCARSLFGVQSNSQRTLDKEEYLRELVVEGGERVELLFVSIKFLDWYKF